MTYDTIIIGAGAAGLAAGRRLHDAGRRILILEARDRIGGRVWTNETFADHPVEMGAEFIHGEHAITHELAREAGLHVIHVPRIERLWWGSPAQPRDSLPAHTRSVIERLLSAYKRLPEQFPSPSGEGLGVRADFSLADYLRAIGFDAGALAIADVLLAQTCCASIDTLSVADLVREMQVDHAGEGDYRIIEGYAPLIRHLARDIPIQLGAAVTRIRRESGGVTVTTTAREFTARTCILTLPVSVLPTIAFDPPLSAAKREAIAAFRTEPATKLIYHFRKRLWDADLTYMAHEGIAARWWTPGYGREGSPLLAAYLTAERARHVDSLPEGEALALGLREAGAMLGADLAGACIGAKRMAWAHEPFSRGGYAHLPPGMADARLALAAPEGDSLFFAGEATAHDTNPQTVHGAVESGYRAAGEIQEI